MICKLTSRSVFFSFYSMAKKQRLEKPQALLKYFTGVFEEFYFTKGSQNQFSPKKHPERNEGCFLDQIGQGNPFKQNFLISQKSSCTQFYRFWK